jgi:tetratricopeptide (TPR) repeat protein
MKQTKEWYEEAAKQENEWVRAVIMKPNPVNRLLQSDALQIATRASDMAGRALGKFHPSYAEALQNIGVYYSALGDETEKANEYFDRARTVVGPYHPVLSRSFYFLGRYHLDSGKLEQAEVFLNEALGILRRTGYPLDPRIADVLTMLARIKTAQKEFHEATACREEVAYIEEAIAQIRRPKSGGVKGEGRGTRKKGKAAR